MALKHSLDSLDGVTPELAKEYSKGEDGKYYLSVEGGEDIVGLKANASKLITEKRQLQAKLEALADLGDPEKAREAMSKLKELEETDRKIREKELMDKGEVEKVVNMRTEAMKTDHSNQVKALTERSSSLEAENVKMAARLSKALIERGLIDAANEVGQLRKDALQDFISRGLQVWKLNEEGDPTPYDANGSILYGKTADKPKTMLEWTHELVSCAEHLWEPSKGGGAKGSIASLGGIKMSSEDFAKLSPTEKARLAPGRA